MLFPLINSPTDLILSKFNDSYIPLLSYSTIWNIIVGKYSPCFSVDFLMLRLCIQAKFYLIAPEFLGHFQFSYFFFSNFHLKRKLIGKHQQSSFLPLLATQLPTANSFWILYLIQSTGKLWLSLELAIVKWNHRVWLKPMWIL